MRVGVVHDGASRCRCHVSLAAALKALGHLVVCRDSEEVPLRADELAGLDLVFDQTDRFRGEGLLRGVVRTILECHEARLVGSSAAALFLADDKAAARARLARAGIRVPPGVTAASARAAHGLDLPFPRVVKPAHEHQSRGLALVHDEAGQVLAILAVLDRFRGPCLVEAYIPGRELAVTVVGDPGGEGPHAPRVLPVAEWPLADGERVLTEAAKNDGPDPVAVELPEGLLRPLEEAALRAFRTMGLADLARFDLRLDPEGQAWFLEANAIPSLEAGSPTLVSAAAAGMDPPALVAHLLAVAARRHARGGEGPSGATSPWSCPTRP